MTLTPRDLDIALTLARRVRLMTLDDLVRVWWPESYSFQTAWHRLRELARGDWVQLTRVNLRSLPATDPQFAWTPEGPEPNAGRVSRAARSRWSGPAVPTAVAFAGRPTCTGAPPAASRL